MVMGGVAGEVRGRRFFGVVPPADAALRIYRLGGVIQCARRLRGALTSRDRLHVTLFSLGRWNDVSEHSIWMALEAAAEVENASGSRFRSIARASFRGHPGRQPFVLMGGDGLNGVKKLRRTLGAAMTRKGLRRWANADFNPHVTLLYDTCNVEEQPIVPICWTVSEFVLIHSDRGHTHLARWPLRG